MTDAAFADVDVPGARVVAGFPVLGPAILYGKIGEGASSVVYLATHAATSADVAVKVLKPSAEGMLAERFRREARFTARFRHDAFVRLLGQGVDRASGARFMVLEFVPGESLQERVAREGSLTLGQAVSALRSTAEGLAELHRGGLVHRDVKPSNLLVSHRGEIKIADLGIAKALPTDSPDASSVHDLTITGEVLGSDRYMAPEQRTAARHATPAADVYALGGVFLFMVTGFTPNKAEKVHELPEPLAAWVKRCRRHRPEDRFQDAGEALAAFDEAAKGIQPEPLEDPSLRERLREWYRLRPSAGAVQAIREQAPETLRDYTRPTDFRMNAGRRRLLLILLGLLAVLLGIVAGKVLG